MLINKKMVTAKSILPGIVFCIETNEENPEFDSRRYLSHICSFNCRLASHTTEVRCTTLTIFFYSSPSINYKDKEESKKIPLKEFCWLSPGNKKLKISFSIFHINLSRIRWIAGKLSRCATPRKAYFNNFSYAKYKYVSRSLRYSRARLFVASQVKIRCWSQLFYHNLGCSDEIWNCTLAGIPLAVSYS